jgi:hypothetical protein
MLTFNPIPVAFIFFLCYNHLRKEVINMRIYANLLGTWTDITDTGTLADFQDPTTYIKENLRYLPDTNVAECFKHDYINVQYNGHNYRLHPSMIQIVDYN